MPHSLSRSRSDSILGGVCGGLAAYFDVSSDFIRLFFILFAAAGGAGVLVYFALWLVLPEEGREEADLSERVQRNAEEIADRARRLGHDARRSAGAGVSRSTLILAVLLILFGVVFLLRNLGITWLRWLGLGTLWPVFPIALGVLFIWRSAKGGPSK